MPERDPDSDRGIFVGAWYTRWPGDPLPALPPLPFLAIAPANDDRVLAALAGSTLNEVAAHRAGGNRPYLAYLDGEAVACGWCTGVAIEIGELDLAFSLPSGNRYLWGFVTAAPWRGRGLYPHLLQAMLRGECGDDANRAWIGHAPDNVASARGILKAGFRRVGDVFFAPGGGFNFVPVGPLDRARAGAALLGATLHDRPDPAR